jgi:hypothetical protein
LRRRHREQRDAIQTKPDALTPSLDCLAAARSDGGGCLPKRLITPI